MTYTNDWKELHIDELFDWVSENKFDEINYHAEGTFKESYEDDVSAYIQDNADDLWKEFLEEYQEYDDEMTLGSMDRF